MYILTPRTLYNILSPSTALDNSTMMEPMAEIMAEARTHPIRISSANDGLPLSPTTSGGESSSGLTRSSRYGSISTLATSNAVEAPSEWEKRRDSAASMEFDEPQVSLPVSQRPKGHYSLADFYIHRTLGTGSFGRVHLGESPFIPCSHLLMSASVRSKHNLRFYAVKVLSKDKVVRTKQVQHTNNEREMLEAVQHPFIVNLWGTFQDSMNLYMVMDFVAGGELFTLLRRSNVRTQAWRLG